MSEPNWGLVLMDVVKTTVPALIVFITIYYLSKQFFQNQENLAGFKANTKNRDKTVALKLQAFERLMLFCDRFDVASLAMRLNGRDLSATDLMQAMLISIQKEYEHNLAQQLYVSDQLWEIISQAKTGTINLISTAHGSLPNDATARDLMQAIQIKMEEIQMNPSEQAKKALRTEASQLFTL